MRGFYIGRFQPYHNGHQYMVEEIAEEVDELVLGIGSAGDSHTEKNPFTAGERVMMLTKAVQPYDLTTYVVPIEDLDRNSVWVSHVQSMSPAFEVAYSNNPLVIQLFEEAGVEVRQSPMFNRDVLEGSELRQRMIHGEPWKHLVPAPVVEVIEEVDGVERLQRVSETDSTDDEYGADGSDIDPFGESESEHDRDSGVEASTNTEPDAE
ncbi:nicotinamide-nucleotide adenylyltransferase [Halalkaliarchaeum desulfuricum]|uniref:Nicotinamide-nucleotide adenylyltransferase n=1 Tax=Halalkaliarchaeum desulfuricum TaxID=2055893 RepID=A0A343TIA2_9EURY|nr:nicotinamide-nucleotide adenylyltransferase [Halalkaliarchaeum desulfuricum]AUX08824.1 nicotinamide-nucleotide adenylyltransferase [Halalkaliarchaeum desulfuricum]